MNRIDKKNKAGFTLLELIIVMAIIMTISGISLTVIQMIARDQAMSTTAIKIENLITKYRNKTMSTQDPYQIIFDRHRNSIRVFWCGIDGVLDKQGDANAGRDDILVEELFLDWDMKFDKAVIERQYMRNANDKTAPMPPDDPDAEHSDYNGKQDEDDEVYAAGALILHADGSIEFAKVRPAPGNFQNVPLYQGGEGAALEDEPALDVAHSKFGKKIDAEIIISRAGERKRILIEINPNTGKVSTKITVMEKEDEPEEDDDE